MPFGVNIKPLGHLAAAMARIGSSLYQAPPNTIANVNPQNWPSALQPVQPQGPPNSQPLGIPYQMGQNQTFTPRYDAPMTASELRALSTYPLARICIENVKDQLCQLPWKIQLEAQPGEGRKEVAERRRVQEKGDQVILALSRFFECPDGESDWSTWIRKVIDDMLVIDAASILKLRKVNGSLYSLKWIPGDDIVRYIDDQGFTPQAPSPAYGQLYYGVPRVQFDTTQLMYRPRNITPRNFISSYLYGYSPVEQVAQEIRIGMARLEFVWQYYKSGSVPNAIQVIPSTVSVDNMRQAMVWANSELSGNLESRRTWRAIQGFSENGQDQILFPKEPVLADVFDDLHIRKICFAFGTSPQRLQRMMNRASAQTSQQSAEDEGIRPWMNWIISSIMRPLIHEITGGHSYGFSMELEHDADEMKQTKIDDLRVSKGLATINEIRTSNGEDPSADPAADQLAITTPTGRVPISLIPPNTGGGPVPVHRGDSGPPTVVPKKGAHYA